MLEVRTCAVIKTKEYNDKMIVSSFLDNEKLTSNFPLEPPIASQRGFSSEKETEKTAPCRITKKKNQVVDIDELACLSHDIL